MVQYPFYKSLQDVTLAMSKGNFGLWYNKFVPLSADFKASNNCGDANGAVDFYLKKYVEFSNNKDVKSLLEAKLNKIEEFCKAMSSRYEFVRYKAKLKTDLITGIGESHPSEVGMVFDYNIGVPYIPASGVKGIVRFAHTLGLIEAGLPEDKIKDVGNGRFFDDEEEWTNVPTMFGTKDRMGAVMFFDAYPEIAPKLRADIMNPHYSEYYIEGTKSPADNSEPKPIKFLAVTKDTEFIFCALVEKGRSDILSDLVKDALKKALTEEGIGAKTAVGYGIFDSLKEIEVEVLQSLLDIHINKMKNIKASDAGSVGSSIDNAFRALLSEDDKRQYAQFVKGHIGKAFDKSKAKNKLEQFLNE